jgi:hypothetical protein
LFIYIIQNNNNNNNNLLYRSYYALAVHYCTNDDAGQEVIRTYVFVRVPDKQVNNDGTRQKQIKQKEIKICSHYDGY